MNEFPFGGFNPSVKLSHTLAHMARNKIYYESSFQLSSASELNSPEEQLHLLQVL
jgi:hypothetical protein